MSASSSAKPVPESESRALHEGPISRGGGALPSEKPVLIAAIPAHERPRERLVALGADALRDSELLAILLRTGRHGQSVLELAERVLQRFDGSLSKLSTAGITELKTIPGIGMAKAVEIRAAFALARRLAADSTGEASPLDSPLAVYKLFRERLRTVEQEKFYVLMLDSKNFLLAMEQITVGLVDRTQIHPREVFRNAIRENCSRIILVHNHPSGDPTPSAPDIAATRQLIDAGEIIGIRVLDHIVIGNPARSRGTTHISFREKGLM